MQCKIMKGKCGVKGEKDPDDLPAPLQWLDAITADHKILNDQNRDRKYDQSCLIIQDRFTKWIQGFTSTAKSADSTAMGLRRFCGPQSNPKHVYTDNSLELKKALNDLHFNHDTSTPHRSETNGIAERAVRRVKEGAACQLVQSGFDEWWCGHAVNIYCFQRNILDGSAETGNLTPWKARFNTDFKGPIWPFGTDVSYKPISSKDKARCHGLGNPMLKGLFVGYDQQSGGGLVR